MEKFYAVKLKGMTSLLMHRDNLEHADEMTKWKDDPQNRKDSKAGDDRTPSWRWLGCVYHDRERVCLPAENIQRMMMEGGAMVPVPGGKSGKTFKSQSQSGMMPVEQFWILKVRGREIPWNALLELKTEAHFGMHIAKVRELGFDLFVKRAKIGQSKHIRVRPRFDEWEASGTIRVWDDQITRPILQQILKYGGEKKGIGDWRPSSRTPGWFGMFEATVKEA